LTKKKKNTQFFFQAIFWKRNNYAKISKGRQTQPFHTGNMHSQ